MTSRPTIADLAAAAGVSVATVDRVLNRRLPVRAETATLVLQAAEALGYHGAPLLKQRIGGDGRKLTLGFLLQKRADPFYQQLAAEFTAATRDHPGIRGKAVVEFIDELSPSAIAEQLRLTGARADAVAVVSVDHPQVSAAIAELGERGVPVFAVLTDLTAEARAGYIGRDNRREGRTAAWLMARTARRPGKIGIIIGSFRYLCQETAEISFRSYCREHAPEFQVLEPLVNLDDPRIAYEATLDLIARNPELSGIYICGGGGAGVIDAVREELGPGRLVVVGTELLPSTRAALIDGTLTAVMSTARPQLAARTVEAMVRAIDAPAPDQPAHIVVPFELYISENV